MTGLAEGAAIGIGAVAEGQGVRLTGVTPNVPSGGEGGFVPTLVDRLPDDAIAYLGFQDPASAVATGFGEAQGDAAEGLKQQVQFFSGQLQAALGVSTDDLAALFGGEAGIAVLPGVEFPGVVIMLKVDDPQRATATLEALRTGIPQILGFAGAVEGPARFRQVPLENDVRGWELPVFPGLSAVYGIDGDVVYIGTSTEAIIQLQSPGLEARRLAALPGVDGRHPGRDQRDGLPGHAAGAGGARRRRRARRPAARRRGERRAARRRGRLGPARRPARLRGLRGDRAVARGAA